MFRSTACAVTLGILLLGLLTADLGAGQIHPSLLGPNRFASSGDSVDVWVMFRDRGFADDQALARALDQAEKSLLPANRTRRLKVRKASLVDEHDLPLNSSYVQEVLNSGVRYRSVSRYLNALSVRSNVNTLATIAALPFVREVRPVAKGRRYEPEPSWKLSAPGPGQPPGVDVLDYGPSYAQLNQINVVAAHDSGYSGAGVLVCLLDTGFFTDHEALVNQPVIGEWDFINNDPETQNQPGDDPNQHDHGTYTFSTLGGAHDGDLYGPAYGATFIIGKTESIEFEQPIEENWYVAGLEWADSLGAQVVSTSLGYFDWYTFENLDGNTAVTTVGVDIAVGNGIVCVTAAGNERGSSWGHIIAPSDADSVIAVGAVNSQGVLASFSSPGPTYDGRIKPEVCARGVSTWCAVPWGGSTTSYSGVSGTSLSTPLLGGSCALLLEAHPDWTPMQVREALMMTASNAAAPDNDYGWGIIDVMAAIYYNFPPYIVAKHPDAGTVIVPQDTLQEFCVVAEDPESDPLTYHWWVDDLEQYVGSDSAYGYVWTSAGTSLVKVYVEDVSNGEDSASWEVQVEPSSGIEPVSGADLPTEFALYQNFPNPFNPVTTLSFDLPLASEVTLEIYDLSGCLVKTPLAGHLEAGQHHYVFNASGLASGIYFCKLEAADFIAVRKLVLTR